MAELKLPERVVELVGEWEKGTDVTRILWKHQQAVQGCYTHKLKVRDARAMLMRVAVRPDTDEPYGGDCPLEGCGEWHGTFRHVQMGCKEAQMAWCFRASQKTSEGRACAGCIVDNTSTCRVSGGCARIASSGTQGHYTSTRGGRRGQRATCGGRPWRSTGVCPEELAERSAGMRPSQALPRGARQ
jgi:hypothetical protein